MKHVVALLACVVLGVACERSASSSTPNEAPRANPEATPAADAGSASSSSAAAQREVVVFSGAAGWSGGRSCTDVRPDDGCDSQWLRTDADGNGQVVRVFVVDVKEERALAAFVDKLSADVANKGGVVERFMQNGLTLVRFLQPVKDDEGMALASINYALVGRDKKAVHLITSVVDFDEQQAADARVRALLAFASWVPR